MPDEVHEQDLVVLNPTRELIHASHLDKPPAPTSCTETKGCCHPLPNTYHTWQWQPDFSYHVVRYNVITPKWNAVAKDNNPLVFMMGGAPNDA